MNTVQIDNPTDPRKAVQMAAGRKAAETRRRNAAAGSYPYRRDPATAQPPEKKGSTARTRALARTGEVPRHPAIEVLPPLASSAANALAAFERMTQSESPDWHAAALLLKSALADGSAPSRVKRITAPKVKALPPPAWPDYDVTKVGARDVRNPTVVVTFADGEVVRAPAVSIKNKPTNIGRAVRIAVAYYQARACKPAHVSVCGGPCIEVPEIVACECPEKGETFDPALCTMKTVETRAPRRITTDIRPRLYRHVRTGFAVPAARAWAMVNGRAV